MISSDNYTSYEVENCMLRNTEYWDEEADEDVTIYDNIFPLTDISACGGLPFPNVQNIITALYEQEETLIAHFGNTEVYIVGGVEHAMYEEAIYASITVRAWTEIPDDIAAGGDILSVEAQWARESMPASEADGRRVLRWLYECFQDEWNVAFSEACSVMHI